MKIQILLNMNLSHPLTNSQSPLPKSMDYCFSAWFESLWNSFY